MADPNKTTPVEDPPPAPQTAAEIAATEQAVSGEQGLEVAAPAAAVRQPVRMGVAPQSIEDAWRLSKFIAQSEMVPKGYRKRPADVLVAIQLGMELGLPPMAALHSIFVANGQPSLYGDGFLAVIMASPLYKDHDEYFMVGGERREFITHADLQKDDTTAVCTFWRANSVRPRTATFSVAKAKKASLWGKAGPWSEYPDRMLKFRARGFAGRDAFPDVLRGIRIDVEVGDIPPEPPVVEVQRRSEAVTTAAAPAPPVIEPVRLGPITVDKIEPFMDAYLITLADGTLIEATDATDALDLEKLRETKQPLRFACMPDGARLHLQSFAVAE